MPAQLPSVEERLTRLLVAIGQPGTCRGCQAAILWVTHRNGKATPYDGAAPTMGVNHFITCPKADDFKRGK